MTVKLVTAAASLNRAALLVHASRWIKTVDDAAAPLRYPGTRIKRIESG